MDGTYSLRLVQVVLSDGRELIRDGGRYKTSEIQILKDTARHGRQKRRAIRRACLQCHSQIQAWPISRLFALPS
jgi:hypothetical protein